MELVRGTRKTLPPGNMRQVNEDSKSLPSPWIKRNATRPTHVAEASPEVVSWYCDFSCLLFGHFIGSVWRHVQVLGSSFSQDAPRSGGRTKRSESRIDQGNKRDKEGIRSTIHSSGSRCTFRLLATTGN